MISVLTGENSFGLDHELHGRTAAFIKEQGDLALERIDGQEADFERIREAMTSLPFLASRKLIVLREPGANKEFVAAVENLASEIPETTDVIFVEAKPDKRTAYYKFLKSQKDYKEFPQLDTNGLASWLVKEAKNRGGELNTSDARYLVERVGIDQQLLAHELEKLLLFNNAVSRESINQLTTASPQSTIFQLLEAAFAGNSRRTLKLYEEQRSLKVEPAQIVAMLSWQLHILATIKTAGDRSTDQIAKEARINPFVVRKSLAIADKLSLRELKEYISNLLQIDMRSKRTNLDTDEALQNYLLELAAN
jgi:DNA polymerase-3 subunit delta